MPHTESFLLVVPEGFTEIVGATTIVGVNGGIANIQSIISGNGFAQLDEYDGIKETSYLPEGFTVVDARFFDTGEPVEPHRLWIKIAPIT